MKTPFIIGISGPSGAGKTSITQYLLTRNEFTGAVLIQLDNYYKDLSLIDPGVRTTINFDEPGAFDWPLLTRHLQDLKSGDSIEQPLYDFSTHTRKTETVSLHAPAILILEGVFTFDQHILHLLDVKIYVDIDPETALARRLKRDVNERGRCVESVINQFDRHVRPAIERRLEPVKRHADYMVDGRLPVSVTGPELASYLSSRRLSGR